MKETKRCFADFSFYDPPAIQQKLEDMAAQGWMFHKPGRFLWTYRQITPQKLRFAVTYFPDASDFDPAPTEAQLTKEEFCAVDGWQLAARWGSMQIFYSAQPDAVPIETDPITQVENIHRAMKKAVLFSQLISLALVLFIFLTQIALFKQDPIDYLANGPMLYLIPIWLEMLVISLIEIGSYFSWYAKAKKAAEDGIFLPVKSRKKASYLLSLLSIFFLMLALASINASLALTVLVLITVSTAALTAYGIKLVLKKKGVSRTINQIVTIASAVLLMLLFNAALTVAIVSGSIHLPNDSAPIGAYTYDGRTWDIYADPLPLEIEDLMTTNAQWSKRQERDETILLSRTAYSQRALLTEDRHTPDLAYTIVTPKTPALYPMLKQAMLDAHQDEVHGDFTFYDSYFPVDAAPWQAEEAYQLRWSDTTLDTYLLCWPDRLVEIHFYWTPTVEQIAIVTDKLGK